MDLHHLNYTLGLFAFLIFKNVEIFLLQDTHHTIHDILLLRIFSSKMSPFSTKTEPERSLFQLPNHCF